jgi:hypothetical protein
MATKKKAAKKKATKKTAAKSKSFLTAVLRWNPRRGGDPPPPFFNKLDQVAQKQFTDFINQVLTQRQG